MFYKHNQSGNPARNILGTALLGVASLAAISVARDARSDTPDGFLLSPDAQAGRYHVRVEGGYAIRSFSLACRGMALVIEQDGKPSITVRPDTDEHYAQTSSENARPWPCPSDLTPQNHDAVSEMVGRELKDSLSRQP
jgi:hypothetical protein